MTSVSAWRTTATPWWTQMANALAPSPPARLMVSASSQVRRIWNLHTGRKARRFWSIRAESWIVPPRRRRWWVGLRSC